LKAAVRPAGPAPTINRVRGSFFSGMVTLERKVNFRIKRTAKTRFFRGLNRLSTAASRYDENLRQG
jgi:hypothetical protein